MNQNTSQIMVLITDEEKIKALTSAGFFSLDSGRVEVNINNGQIQNITIHKMTYRRTAKNDTIPI